MSSQYSTKNFFRKAPNTALAEYFESLDSGVSIDLAVLGETDIEELHDSWLRLDEEKRQQAETDFRDVQELACELGIANVRFLATWEPDDLLATLAAMEDDYDRSFWVFLRHREVFDNALRLLEADRLPGRSWKKCKGLPHRPPATDDRAMAQLRDDLMDYFRRSEGRGHHCQVEPFARAEKHYFFVFAEDHSRAEQDFEGGSLQRRSHRPAFEVVFLYDPTAGTLDTCAQGGQTTIRELQKIFASVALGHQLKDDEKDDRVYDLSLLMDGSFRFVYNATSRISDVSVRKLRVSLPHSRGHRVTVEAPTQSELYDRYGREVASLGESEIATLTHVEIQVSYSEDGGRRPRKKTFTLTWPNSCNLGQDERDGVLREMLIASGVDPSGLGRDAQRR